MKPDTEQREIIPIPEPSKEGIEGLLAGSFIPGIGRVFASRLAERFGARILYPAEIDLAEISDVPGISLRKAEELKASLLNLPQDPGLLAFLYGCGLADIDIEKIISHYKKHTPGVVLSDPYEMVEEVWKFSFFRADRIGKGLSIPQDDPRRLRGALLTAVKLHAENGSLFATPAQLLETAARISGCDSKKLEPEIAYLLHEERLIESKGGIYLPVYYKAEKETAEKLGCLLCGIDNESKEFEIPQTDLEGHILSEEQKNAIKTVMENPVTVITGGPGTGKTTAMRGVIRLFEDIGKNVILTAPTGRAVKRMSDITGAEAKTIHRLLGYNRGKGYRNKNFEGDILIIDEASMLEQVLFNHLLQALPDKTKVVLVGDTGQLPPIGAGDVLNDMMASGKFPVITLTQNFRQKAGSKISESASTIKKGMVPPLCMADDFMIHAVKGSRNIHQSLMKLVKEDLPQRLGINPREIQVVSPQQEGLLGAKQLNMDLQDLLNPDAPEIKRGMKRFRLGDRVAQTGNNSRRGIYNGETGWISRLNPEKKILTVSFFDGKESEYNYKDLGELSLSYATSVHKLQGSETDYLVMPLTMGHKRLLYRNLLYTAVSRAKKFCALVGEPEALATAVETTTPVCRNSNLRKRLEESDNASSINSNKVSFI